MNRSRSGSVEDGPAQFVGALVAGRSRLFASPVGSRLLSHPPMVLRPGGEGERKAGPDAPITGSSAVGVSGDDWGVRSLARHL